jgi:hypothetical protein
MVTCQSGAEHRISRKVPQLLALAVLILLLAFFSLLSPSSAQAVAPRSDGQAQVGAYGCPALDEVIVDGTNQYGAQAHWDSIWAKEFQKGTTTFYTWNWWWTGVVIMQIKLQGGGWSIPVATQIPPRPVAIQDPFLVPCSNILGG